jgi:dimeric dUTPase (all-alpha-NTP-PPase superfamily)
MPAGRPTHLTEEILEQAREYLDNYDSKHSHTIPSVVGLCTVIKRSRSTVYGWAEDKESEIADILEQINEKQHMVLLSKGLNDEFNASITKLVLGKHGYHEQVKTEATINDYSNMSPEDRQKRLLELQQQIKHADRA